MAPPDVEITDESERPQLRVSLTASIAATAIGIAATAGVTWGIYSQRIDALETAISAQNSDIRAQASTITANDRQIIQVQTQYTEILRRLDNIERKLERP